MTNEFLSRCLFLDEYATAADYRRMDIVETTMDVLAEGIGDRRSVITALSNTHTTFYEILDNIKEALVKLVQRALSGLNNYYINNAKLFQKYQGLIKKGLRTSGPIVHEIWDYPVLKDYPHVISSASFERDILQIHQKMRDPSYARVSLDVDMLLARFAQQTVDSRIDIYRLRESVEDVVRRRLQGKKRCITVTADNIDDIFKMVSNYKHERDDIQRTKDAVQTDYEKLKRTYKAVTERPDRLLPGDRSLKKLYDPDREDFLTNEYNRYANIHVEMMRLFNGYLSIYNEAFLTKLKILDDKYNDYRNLMIEIFTKTGTLAAMGTASPKGKIDTIPYNPKLQGFKT